MSAIFVDVESTGLHALSVPIEVGWGGLSMPVESHLVRDDSWLAEDGRWDDRAERVHRISKADLVALGRPPAEVAARMLAALRGKRVHSDAPSYDETWLSELFIRAGLPMDFEVAPAEWAFLEAAGGDRDTVAAALEAATRISPPAHRAARDVAYLIEVERLCARDAGPRLR